MELHSFVVGGSWLSVRHEASVSYKVTSDMVSRIVGAIYIEHDLKYACQHIISRILKADDQQISQLFESMQ